MARGHSILAAALFLAIVSFVCAAEPPIDLGSKRELFVDGYLIAKLTNARLELACLRDEGTVLKFDQPWEGAFCGYCTVIRDGGLFRLYYRGIPSSGRDGSAAECTCYAESKDGIRWIKPALRLFEKNGTRENNVILSNAEPVTHNFCPFLDTRPDVSLSERHKALGGTANSGLIAYVSGDGIHWKKLRDQPAFKAEGWVFDSQNVPFWSTVEGCYVLYFRKAAGGKRAVARATSPDFVRWSEPAAMIYSDTRTEVPSQHLYTNQTQPYFRARHIYIATAARFMPGRKVVSDREASRLGVHPGYFGDTFDAVLMTSRGGNRYDRTFLEGFLRPGIGLENWVSRTNYPALNIVQTGPAEMSLYANQNYGQPTAHLHRYSLRLDGLASVRAPLSGGELFTRPLRFVGRRLLLNVATSAAGGLRVAIQDADGKPLSGFSSKDCDEVIGNEIERAVSWNGRNDIGALASQVVRLRIEIKDADLYALRFE
ncbi:MAG TPA: hypothetical protein VMR25_28220 [Planctomycetaceae bacterium]|nr:hypothetical protein [Planctomycetaceae bacterium]